MIKKMLTIGPAKILKSGLTGTGKAWTLHEIACQDDDGEVEKFTSFSNYKEMVGQKTAVMLDKVVNGQFTNWREATKSSEAKAEKGKFEEDVKEALRIINGKIDKLLGAKNSID
jgi:hypothetical protein